MDVRHKMIQVRLRLIDARQCAGMSQARAAELLGIHRPSLSMIEAGDQRLTVDMMLLMCDVYGVLWGDILRYGDETTARPVKPVPMY